MLMNVFRAGALLLLGWLPINAVVQASGFRSFDAESDRSSQAFSCPSARVIPGGDGFGALWSCIKGRSETVKWFINEAPPGSGQVGSVKVLWNDWYRDLGDGLHADRGYADEAIAAISRLYAPKHKANLTRAFRGNRAQTITAGPFRLEYTYSRGPAIDERMFVITSIDKMAAPDDQLRILAPDVAESGDLVPFTGEVNPPLQPGDVMNVYADGGMAASITTNGPQIRTFSTRLRLREGDIRIEVMRYGKVTGGASRQVRVERPAGVLPAMGGSDGRPKVRARNNELKILFLDPMGSIGHTRTVTIASASDNAITVSLTPGVGKNPYIGIESVTTLEGANVTLD